jgi:FkbM family methyltransferase
LSLARLGYGNAGGQNRSGESRFIREVVAKIRPEVCLDIGANQGDYSNLLLTYTQAEVHCFEPLDPMVRKLTERFEDHAYRVQIHSMCLADYNGTTTIKYDPNETMMTSLANEVKHKSATFSQTVEVKKLDSFIESFYGKKVDLIKIDTEGFEKEVLIGSLDFLTRFKPAFIQFEFGQLQLLRCQTLHELCNIVDGYDLHQITPNGLARRNSIDFLSNIFIYSNFVLVRKDVDL